MSYGPKGDVGYGGSHRPPSSSLGIADDNPHHDWNSCRLTERTQYSHLSPEFQRGTVQLLNGLCEGVLKEEISKGSEGHSEKIVKNCQKNEEVRQSQSPNPSISLVELMGIEPTAS